MSNHIEHKENCSCCHCHPHEKKIYIPVPRTWGNIVGDIMDQTDLIELLQTISSTSAEKEVIRVSTYSSTAPSEPNDGDLYINSSQNILYSFDGEEWVAEKNNPDAVYVTEDANHIYVYNTERTEYIDATGDARTPTAHTHPISDVVELQAKLDELEGLAGAGLVM